MTGPYSWYAASLLLFACIALSKSHYMKKNCGPMVRTHYGQVEGVTKTLFSGKQVDAYMGIPYAAPPIGNLRFAPPHPPMHWNSTTFQAKMKPKSCHQAACGSMRRNLWFVSESLESEDCLYLNIWVPKTMVPMQKLAVIVWIHGVSGMAGSSNMELYDGSVLASEENVIVVSMNYRLSMFGFLYLNLPDAPGNVGMLDQLEALRWVKQNIAMFRGDPEKITLFGESFVGFHLMSPSAWTLFQRAIIVSGPPGAEEASMTMEESLSHAQALSGHVGCSMCSHTHQAMLDSLRSKTVPELLAPYKQLPKFLRSPFAPNRNDIEVPMHPEGAAMHVPHHYRKNVMIGTTSEDSAIFMSAFFNKTLAEDTCITEEELLHMLMSLFDLKDDRLVRQVLFQYKERGGHYNPAQVRKEAVQLITDFLVVCGTNDFVEQYSSTNSQVFQYYFTYRPTRAVKTPTPAWAGSVRGDDLTFVFGLPLNSKEGYTQQEVHLSKQMMGYWASFARTG